jgi:ketosteroid isomerase-like protein
MTAANPVALVEAAIDAYNRRDLPALRGLMTEDVELRPPVSALTGHAYRGHDGIAQWLHDVDESFASAEIVPLELRDLGAKVLALTRRGLREPAPAGLRAWPRLRHRGRADRQLARLL